MRLVLRALDVGLAADERLVGAECRYGRQDPELCAQGERRLPRRLVGRQRLGEFQSRGGKRTLRVLGGALPAVTVNVDGRASKVPALRAGEAAELG
jgi:hypothetical protein